MPRRSTTDGHNVVQGVICASLPDPAFVPLRELDALFRQSPAALVFHDRELRARRTNAALRRLVGLPDEAIIGRRPTEFDGGVDAALGERILAEQVIDRGVPVVDMPPVQGLAGKDRPLSWSAHPVTDNGQVLGAVSCFRDITGRATSLRQAHALLERAGHQIGTTLDIHRTAAELADLAVPGLADRIAIDLLDQVLEGENLPRPGSRTLRFRRVAVCDTTGAKITYNVGDLITAPLTSSPASAAWRRKPALARNPTEIHRLTASYAPGHEEALLARGVHTAMAVPLVARGVTLGLALVSRAEDPEPFDEADVRLVSDLASRAAVCIDNARLYHRERRTAFALQRGLLPAEPRVPAGVEVAHLYLPVGASMVGGDWHDIVALPDGRVALVVGDAMGHGPEAAAVMVQLRTATHLLAGLDMPPATLLASLDTMVAGMPGSPYATCICAVIDTGASTCVIAAAGHPPPVLALPDGSTEVLSVPAGLPLGLSAGTFEAAQVTLPPGATLALYTDGLAESRTRPLDDGIAALRIALSSALDQPGTSLDSASETISQALRQRGEDDITLVLARIRQ
jgi:PAS domain S-box-containing protein